MTKPEITGCDSRNRVRHIRIGVLPAVAGRHQPCYGTEVTAIIAGLYQQALCLVIISGMNDNGAAGKGFVKRILYPAGFVAAKGLLTINITPRGGYTSI